MKVAPRLEKIKSYELRRTLYDCLGEVFQMKRRYIILDGMKEENILISLKEYKMLVREAKAYREFKRNHVL